MTKRSKNIVVYTTFPDLKSTRSIVHGLIEKRLIACGNIFKVESQYRWQGQIEKANEYAAILKTKRSLYKSVENYIKKNHPYEVPAIVEINIDRGFIPYLHWIDSETI